MSKSIKLKNNIYLDARTVEYYSNSCGRKILSDIIENLTGGYKNASDLNNAITPGLYNYYLEHSNKPSSQISGFADYGLIFVIKTGTWIYQIAIGNYGSPIMARRVSTNSGSSFGNWEVI